MLNKSAPKEDVQKIIDKAIEQFVCHMTHLSEEKGVWSMEHSAVPVVVDCPEELVCNLPNTSKLFFFKDTAWTVTADKTKLPFKEFAEAMYEEMGIYAKTAAFYAAESY